MVNDTSKTVVPVEEGSQADEPLVLCIIRDETTIDWKNAKYTVNLPASSSVEDLINHVSKEANYVVDSFLIVWTNSSKEEDKEIPLNGVTDRSLADFGLFVGGKNLFLLKAKDGEEPKKLKDDGDDANDTLSTMFPENNAASASSHSGSYYSSDSYYTGKSDTGFVGLVNQAMTCYLNSLLQTLYMTPEFRNAIYRWEATGSEEQDIKCIPSQLQKLFLHLQTSDKKAVETTDLTKSFGWDSSEAWHQHDVQELCRVMFDALESKLKSTDQGDLINKLYQGKVKDYVKCLECGNESARTDTYLDIPLAIRPFGENRAFGSVEESLEAFVSHETLSDNNQYFCEKCNKKCDAHKGLKFLSFPYLLTIQLKRFAFDYNTLHRIKLNDRMTFPKFLNLNRFIEEERSTDDKTSMKGDSPSSTETDSGVSEGCSENGILTEDEEGGEVASGGDQTDDQSDEQEEEGAVGDQKPSPEEPKGPYIYELFSIMIHSGSANGGHYYAYIKSLDDGCWYCFNDQSVTRVGDEEIERTYGGSEYNRAYYSSLYSSSTNAYMLEYRQVAPQRNKKFLEIQEMPKHIVRLSKAIKDHEESERKRKEVDKNTCKIKVFYDHPLLRKVLERKLEVHKDKTLNEAVSMTSRLFSVDFEYPNEQCRLVKYDEYYDAIEKSFEGDEDTPMGVLLGGVKSSYMFELLLETRKPEETFPVYKPGGVTLKVHNVDLEEEKVYPPVNVRAYMNNTLKELKEHIAKKLNIPSEKMRIISEASQYELKILDNPNKELKDLGFFKSAKLFVESSGAEEDVLFSDSKFYKVLDSYQHTVKLCVSLPDPSTKPTNDELSLYVFEDPKEVSTVGNKERDVHVDKRMTLSDLKEKLVPLVACEPDFFRVYRVYSNNQEIELTRLNDTLNNFIDETKIVVKYGRALKIGECHIKIYLLKLNDPEESIKYLFDWVVVKGMNVQKCKELIQPELNKRFDIQTPVQNLRLRKKTWKNPGTVYVDSQTFDEDIAIYANFEVFIEELDGPERMTDSKLLSVYTCHWRPSSFTLEPLQEVILSDSTVDELKEEISKLSNIPLENLDFAKGRGPFPCTISVLEIDKSLDWNPDSTMLRTSPLYITDDGAVIYYRDKTEEMMEISEEKKQEIMKKENAKTNTTAPKTVAFSYKEKALKIYKDGVKPTL